MYAVMWSRALLLQVVAGPPAAPAHRGAVGARRPGRERRRGRRRRRHRRRRPHREPQPPVGHRALPGRGHRRRRHPARHLHHGGPPDRGHGPAALRPARRPPQPLDRRGRRQRHLRLRQLRRACPPSAARSSSTSATPSNPLVNVLCLGVLPRERPRARHGRRASGNLAVLLGSTTGRDGIGGVSVLASAGFGDDDGGRRPSGRACRSATRSRRSGSSRRASRCSTPGSSSASRTSAAPASPCATSETASRGGVGMDVDVAEVPAREPGMEPFEVMTSESQERMLAIVAPRATSTRCSTLCRRWEVRAIGRRHGHRHGPRCASSTGSTARCWPTSRPRRCTTTPRSTTGPAGARPTSTPAEPTTRRGLPPPADCGGRPPRPARRHVVGLVASTTTSCSSTPSTAPAATPPCCG